jgi:hypothetical protein
MGPEGLGEGEAEDLTRRGKALVAEGAGRAREAIELLDRAAHLQGGGEAAALVAVLAGAGAGTGQSWPAAIDYLTRSAELGWDPARLQMAMLSADAALAEAALRPDAPGELWPRLRRSLDLRPWLTPATGVRALSESPAVFTAEAFLPPAACDWLIGRAESRRRRATVYDPDTGAALADPARSNTAAEIPLSEWDLILLLATARIGATLKVPLQVMEPTNFLHYEVGQEFVPHHDYLDEAEPGYAEDMARRGQRVSTFLVYLNQGFEGGETDFPAIGLRHKPARGGALWFHNLHPDGRPDRRTLHAGLPPGVGEKWILSQWIRRPPGRPRTDG